MRVYLASVNRRHDGQRMADEVSWYESTGALNLDGLTKLD